MGRFRDKVVLITGATSGIGLELARSFTREGAQVVGTGRDPGRLAALGGEVASALALDVTDEGSIEKAAALVEDQFGRVDVLVNNAGIGLFQDWRHTPVSEIQRVFDVNLYGVVRVTQRFLPGMIERKSGTIVNIASVAGKRGYPKHTAYCASKHALIGWSESLRLDLAADGVGVVVICPPAVRTPFFENAGYMTFDEDHPGFVPIGPAEVARQTVDATARGERTRIITARAKILHGLSVVAPGLLDGLRRFKGKH